MTLEIGFGTPFVWLPRRFRSDHGCWFVVWLWFGLFWTCERCREVRDGH